LAGKTQNTQGKDVPMLLCPSKIPHTPTLDLTWASTVKGWQLSKLWHSLGQMVQFMPSPLPDLNLWNPQDSWMT
jgi:hypothetical protein